MALSRLIVLLCLLVAFLGSLVVLNRFYNFDVGALSDIPSLYFSGPYKGNKTVTEQSPIVDYRDPFDVQREIFYGKTPPGGR
jgi:hypothetical protein